MRIRYPDVARSRAHYESVYTALVHPELPQALWIRTTVQQRPGQDPTGALWVTWFEESGVRAAKLSGLPLEVGPAGLTCGPATQGPAGSVGSVDLDTLSASWDVAFEPTTEPLEHLSPPSLYRLPLPRTKATSPAPDLRVSGTVVIDGQPLDLTGWTGMLGHNWGTEHAARWIWLRACGLGEDETGWLDAIVGRVRVGPLLAPWTAFGTISLDGERTPLGGLLTRGTAVDLRPDGADITMTGSGIRVRTQARLSLPSTVGWEYSDPTGGRHEVVNSSVAEQVLTISRGSQETVLRPRRHGVLEIGGDARALDVELQPFAD